MASKITLLVFLVISKGLLAYSSGGPRPDSTIETCFELFALVVITEHT